MIKLFYGNVLRCGAGWGGRGRVNQCGAEGKVDLLISLISAFVVRYLDSVMSLVSVTKMSSLILASVAEQASLSLTWSETPENKFSHGAAQIVSVFFTLMDL